MSKDRIQLGEIVALFGGILIGVEDVVVTGIAPLDVATASQITFLTNPKLRAQAQKSDAAAIILSPRENDLLDASYAGARIVADNPYAYFARLSQWFVAQNEIKPILGVHRTAFVEEGVVILPSVSIGANAVVERGVELGEGVVIGAGAFVGRNAKIGAYTQLDPRAVLHTECEIGERGVIRSGAVIGTEGFGFANDKGKWIKIPQVGRVVLGDDVQVGANTTIDRGTLSDTIIGNGVKLDNQIQVAHNCQIGENSAMAGCAALAGSTIIGKNCTLGGAALVAGHLTLEDGVHISAGTFVDSSIKKAGQYTGVFPIFSHAEWGRAGAVIRNLTRLREKVRTLEKELKTLKENEIT